MAQVPRPRRMTTCQPERAQRVEGSAPAAGTIGGTRGLASRHDVPWSTDRRPHSDSRGRAPARAARAARRAPLPARARRARLADATPGSPWRWSCCGSLAPSCPSRRSGRRSSSSTPWSRSRARTAPSRRSGASSPSSSGSSSSVSCSRVRPRSSNRYLAICSRTTSACASCATPPRSIWRSSRIRSSTTTSSARGARRRPASASSPCFSRWARTS